MKPLVGVLLLFLVVVIESEVFKKNVLPGNRVVEEDPVVEHACNFEGELVPVGEKVYEPNICGYCTCLMHGDALVCDQTVSPAILQ